MPIPEWVPIRDDLRGFEPYGAPQIRDVINLNVNENPYAPSAQVAADIADAVRVAAADLNRYPDREATALRVALASYLDHGLTSDRVWAANGSNEVMLQILQAFGGPGRTALSFAPTYSMYPEYARDTHTRWVTGTREDDFTIDVDRALTLIATEQPEVVLLTSPNNPTGTALPLATVRAVVEAEPGVVVVDEAYAEFVSRTMSKAFGMAGARLGYLAADPAVVTAVQLVRLPDHLSAVSQAVARTALAHADELQAQVALLRDERDALVAWLRGRGHIVADSDANFVLFGHFEDRHAIWQGLLERGVLIRETGPESYLRVSVGTPEENAAFRAALEEVTA